jgi:branched-chain amino acid transport system ATP-binding protein
MLLEVNGLAVAYDGVPALRGVSLRIGYGECVAIIGPNGAGKSTLVKTIAGILQPAQGEILFEGLPITGVDTRQLVAQAIVYIPQGRRVFPSLTVLENIEVMLGIHGRRERKRIIEDLFSQFPILSDRGSVLAGQLSGGEQQIVALARALTAKPKLLLLDEPSFGLSPRWTDQVFEKIESLQDIAVVLVEQNVRKALSLAERGYVLRFGEIVREGRSSDLADYLQSDWGLTASAPIENSMG